MVEHDIEDMLNVGALACRLKVKPSWVYAHANDLGVLRLGKYLRFSWQRVLAQLTNGAADKKDVIRIRAGSK
jgi:hypothetical protein